MHLVIVPEEVLLKTLEDFLQGVPPSQRMAAGNQ
jgi:hypothetical protein